MKIQNKIGGGGRVWLGGEGLVLGGGGYEQRSEAFVKIKKKNVFWGVGGRGVRLGGGVRVDVNEEVSFCDFFLRGVGWGGGCQIRGGVGEGGSKVWGRWVI